MKRSTHCLDVTSGCDNWRRALAVFREQDVPENELNKRIQIKHFADEWCQKYSQVDVGSLQ